MCAAVGGLQFTDSSPERILTRVVGICLADVDMVVGANLSLSYAQSQIFSILNLLQTHYKLTKRSITGVPGFKVINLSTASGALN